MAEFRKKNKLIEKKHNLILKLNFTIINNIN